jgi:xanthine dehydrogenase accessory factor
LADVYRQLNAFIAEGQPCALATLVSTSGSSPQNTGASVLFLPDGRIIGTIGGGCMEAEARRIALDCLRSGRPKLFELRLDDDFGWDDGLICGGRVQIFINPFPERSTASFSAAVETAEKRQKAALVSVLDGEDETVGQVALLSPRGAVLAGASVTVPVEDLERVFKEARPRRFKSEQGAALYIEPIIPRPTALIAGAGHIGAALTQILSLCGFETVVVDDRPSFASETRLPFADRVVVDEIERFVASYPIHEDCYVAIVTRGHRHDAHVLRACIHSKARYIGMIGSKRKICVIF